MEKGGIIMKSLILIKLKRNILFRKYFLNLLLLFFSPRTKFIIILSQNLDKYIVLYQKQLLYEYNYKQHNSKFVKDIAA